LGEKLTNTAQTVLCFDIGLKRTGVASGHSLTKTASPAGQLTVSNGQFDWPLVDKLIAKWEPTHIVIGDPNINNLSTIAPALRKTINRFKSHIQQKHKLPIIEVDERLTSSAANLELHDRGLSEAKKISLRDQIAACLILETYFNSHF